MSKKRIGVAFVPGVGHLDYHCGASESVFRIAEHMSSKPLFITEGPYGLTPKLAKAGMQYEILESPIQMVKGVRSGSILRKILFWLQWHSYTLRLCRLLKRHEIDVVYTANAASLFAADGVRKSGAKLVTGIRGGIESMGTKKWERVFRTSDQVVALSMEMKADLLSAFQKDTALEFADKVKVIYNGIDLELAKSELNSASETCKIPMESSGPLVLYVAAFRSWKGQLSFIESVVPKIESRASIVFLGAVTENSDEGYFQECKEAASKSAIPMHFVGYQKNVWPWYHAADIVVLASDFEGMPRCVIEAMASGTPVVTYNVCSCEELLIPNQAGLVVNNRDVEGLAAGINLLLEDSKKRIQLGVNGKEYAARALDIKEIARQYDMLFQSLCSN